MALTLAALIFASYTVVAVNTAAIAHGRYRLAAVSGLAFMAANFWLLRAVVEANTGWQFAAYLVGGLAGDMTGIWISRQHWRWL